VEQHLTTFEELDPLSTEELRERAFDRAREHHDLGFFWDLLRHLPAADDAEAGLSIDDAVALWHEFEGEGYGDAEPLLRAKFIDYLSR
jgi:hypothetical protein